MKEGKITREGIKCTCCQEVFTLSKFEAHAGSTLHRPSANIFLGDDRSILECQLQLKREKNVKKRRSEQHQVKGNRHQHANDYICSVCHYGGELLLCDECPSSFHKNCLGLKVCLLKWPNVTMVVNYFYEMSVHLLFSLISLVVVGVIRIMFI